ncbi:MAG: heparinase II/III family protein [Planctomycetota bacterium]
MSVPFLVFCLTLVAILLCADKSDASDKIATHPRLLIDEGGWPAYADRVNSDHRLTPLRNWLLGEAQRLLNQPPLEYRKDGKRLLRTSRFTLMRTLILAQAFRLTGDERYAQRGCDELLNAARFPDWGPDHLLDTAEMCAALSLGYDWLHDQLEEKERATILHALRDKGLGAIDDDHWFWTKNNNWNQVCSGGLTLAAIVLEEDAPELSRDVLERTRASIHHGMAAYEPDGIAHEGPAYWSYGATYNAMMFSALSTAYGDDPVDLASRAFTRSAEFRRVVEFPSGNWWNYADSASGNRAEPALLWFSKACDRPELASRVWPLIEDPEQYIAGLDNPVQAWLLPLALVWESSSGSEAVSRLPTVWRGEGIAPMAILRSYPSEDQPHQPPAVVAIKGGQGRTDHGHLDAGSFVVDMLGQQWAIETGKENYGSIEAEFAKTGGGLWNLGQQSRRWSLLRYHNRFHNTLTRDNQRHDVDGRATVIAAGDQPAPHASIDLTPVFGGSVARSTRSVSLPSADQVVFEDRVAGAKPGDEMAWAWVTDAEVFRESDQLYRLTKGGESVWLRITSGGLSDLRISVFDLDDHRQPFESKNPGVVVIQAVSIGTDDGEHRFAVELNANSPSP